MTTAATGVTPDSLNFLQKIMQGMGFGGENGMKTNEAWGAGLGMAQTGLQAYTGLKQLKLADKQFALQKEAYQTNTANQASANNLQLSQGYDRQLNPTGTKEEYMAKWGY